MARFFKKRTEVIGGDPGDLIYVGSRPDQEMNIDNIYYSRESCLRTEDSLEPDYDWLREKGHFLWMNVNGISRVEKMEEIREEFRIHPLAMADIINTGIRPKLVVNDRDLHIAMKMFTPDEKGDSFVTEQISFFLRGNILLTFQEARGDVFDGLRDRLSQVGETNRVIDSPLLIYMLIDRLIDNYTIVVQHLAEKIENLEDLPAGEEENLIGEIGRYKKEIIYLRKSVLPAKEILLGLKSQKNPYFEEDRSILLNDMESNLLQLLETIEIYKEILQELTNTCNARQNDKLNTIMKTLTIISVIFIPLTFITGIYGTNFDSIPGLHLSYGFALMMGVLVFLAGVMVGIFKRKKWL
ncbi:MAG: magnesium/cobalt transporter CorA [Spirochaetales bacterium]|nr:magnesium/cobalt transporter CorA [Spirochaetales bacterium]